MDDFLMRVPPHSLDSEMGLIGSILLDGEAMTEALNIGLLQDDFYHEHHRIVFGAMEDLADRQVPVDVITLMDSLGGRAELERVGGARYLAELAAYVPTAAHAVHYARIVRQMAMLRNLASVATEIAQESYDQPAENAEKYIDQAERKIFDLAERRVQSSFTSMRELSQHAIALLERLYERKELVTGVPSGFLDLDRITGGFQPGDLIIIAARPSIGKTALALNIAAYAAAEASEPVGVAMFSLEMAKEQLALRLLCSEARVDLAKARSGYLSEREFPRLAEAASRLASAPIYIDDNSETTPLMINAKCRRLARDPRAKLGLVIVDYLQLMRSTNSGESREKEIAEISRSMKGLAKELKVPVIALSQLNRQVETRADRRPMLADLRESGAIEQDADVIAFIYRDEVYHRDTKEPGVAEIIVAKQRNGPTDTAKLTYVSQHTRFCNYAPFEEEWADARN